MDARLHFIVLRNINCIFGLETAEHYHNPTVFVGNR